MHVQDAVDAGVSITDVAIITGLSRPAVYRAVAGPGIAVARRFKHKARAAARSRRPALPVMRSALRRGVALCALVDLDHAVSAATLGRRTPGQVAGERGCVLGAPGPAHRRRAVTPPQLVTWLERRREQSARRALKQVTPCGNRTQ